MCAHRRLHALRKGAGFHSLNDTSRLPETFSSTSALPERARRQPRTPISIVKSDAVSAALASGPRAAANLGGEETGAIRHVANIASEKIDEAIALLDEYRNASGGVPGSGDKKCHP
jgi:hypothetical protein